MNKVTKEIVNGKYNVQSIVKVKDNEFFLCKQKMTFDVEINGNVHRVRVYEDWPTALVYQDLTRGKQHRAVCCRFKQRDSLTDWFHRIDFVEDLFDRGLSENIKCLKID